MEIESGHSDETIQEAAATTRITAKHETFQAWSKVASDLIKYGALVACIYIVYLGIDSLAGLNTNAEINLGVWSNIDISDIVSTLFGLGGTTYGIAQRRLRKDAIGE